MVLIYKETITEYTDRKNRINEHEFKIGELVYEVNMTGGKSDATYKATKHVLQVFDLKNIREFL